MLSSELDELTVLPAVSTATPAAMAPTRPALAVLLRAHHSDVHQPGYNRTRLYHHTDTCVIPADVLPSFSAYRDSYHRKCGQDLTSKHRLPGSTLAQTSCSCTQEMFDKMVLCTAVTSAIAQNMFCSITDNKQFRVINVIT